MIEKLSSYLPSYFNPLASRTYRNTLEGIASLFQNASMTPDGLKNIKRHATHFSHDTLCQALHVQNALTMAKETFTSAQYYLGTTNTKCPPSFRRHISTPFSSCITVTETLLATFALACKRSARRFKRSAKKMCKNYDRLRAHSGAN